jgi:hypothetical protein
MVISFTKLLRRECDINYMSGGVSPQIKGVKTGFKRNLSWSFSTNSACGKEENTDRMQTNSMTFIPKSTITKMFNPCDHVS